MGRGVNFLSHAEQVCYEDTSMYGMVTYYTCENNELLVNVQHISEELEELSK